MAKDKLTTSKGTDLYQGLLEAPVTNPSFYEALKQTETGKLLQLIESLPAETDPLKRQKIETHFLLSDLFTNGEFIPNPDLVLHIPLGLLVPSSFDPQKHRSKHFNPVKMQELAASIKQEKGVFQPIVARLLPDGLLEIVFGERRWRASDIAGMPTVRAVVLILDDEKAFDMQSKENEEREEPEPLAQALTYKYWIEHFKMSIRGLCDKYNKSPKFIHRRLKLNSLIPEVVELIETKRLTPEHGEEIAISEDPLVQAEILAHCTFHGPDRNYVRSVEELQQLIKSSITMPLDRAPFDTADPRLHIKGLICALCPQNTQAEPMLIGDYLDKNARCLNKGCYQTKTNLHMKLVRTEIAAKIAQTSSVPVEDAVKNVPVVTDRTFVENVPFKTDEVLIAQEIMPEPECPYAVASVAVGGDSKGKQVYICRNDDCEIHHPKPEAREAAAQIAQAAINFEKLVTDENRRRVFTEAYKFFDDHKPFWMFEDLVRMLLKKLWGTCGLDTKRFVAGVIENWKKMPKYYYDETRMSDFIDTLDKTRQSQLLFLLIFSQTSDVAELADAYAQNSYQVIDAETRLEFAPPEYKAIAEDYLSKIKNGEVADVPDYFSAR